MNTPSLYPNRTLEQTNTQHCKRSLSNSAWTGGMTALKQAVLKLYWPLILTRTCTFSIHISTPLLLIINQHCPALEHTHTIHEICIFYVSGLLKEKRQILSSHVWQPSPSQTQSVFQYVVKAVHSALQRNIVCCDFAFMPQHIDRNDFTTQRSLKHTT